MTKKYTASYTRFRELVKRDNKRINTKNREKEKRDLLDWFVDNCSAQDGPEKAKKFDDFGIKYGHGFSNLKSRIIENIGLKEGDTYKYCKSGREMEALIDDIEKIYSSRRKAIIFFSKGSCGEMDSLYIRIRNSIAHGNHFKVRNYYYLWNETGSNERLKKLGSFMVLKCSDLKLIYKVLSVQMEE